jgi:hypothetical protein
MILNPYKIVFTSPGGKQFIRYKHRRADLLVQVFEYEGAEILKHHLRQAEQQFAEDGVPFIHSSIEFDDKHYLLIVVDFCPKTFEDINEGAKKLGHPVRRLAQWYKFAYLIPKWYGKPFDE